jgi:hypothetical protein
VLTNCEVPLRLPSLRLCAFARQTKKNSRIASLPQVGFPTLREKKDGLSQSLPTAGRPSRHKVVFSLRLCDFARKKNK